MPAKSKVKVIWKGEDFKRALHFDMKKKMELVCRKIEADIKVSISGPPNTVNQQSSMVGTRSGTLRASITSNWTGGGNGSPPGAKAKARGATSIPDPGGTVTEVRGVVGTNLVYGPVHEFGATIRPKTKKWLTIPFPGGGAVTALGIGRGSAREFKNTFIANDIIFGQPTGKSDKIVPLFILKKQVTIKARPFIRPAIDRNAANVRRVFLELKK